MSSIKLLHIEGVKEKEAIYLLEILYSLDAPKNINVNMLYKLANLVDQGVSIPYTVPWHISESTLKAVLPAPEDYAKLYNDLPPMSIQASEFISLFKHRIKRYKFKDTSVVKTQHYNNLPSILANPSLVITVVGKDIMTCQDGSLIVKFNQLNSVRIPSSELTEVEYNYYEISGSNPAPTKWLLYGSRHRRRKLHRCHAQLLFAGQGAINLADLYYSSEYEVHKDNTYFRTYDTAVFTFKDYIKEQLRTKYSMFPSRTDGRSNLVMDTFFPRILHASQLNVVADLNEAKLSRTAVAISPYIAEQLGIRQIPLEQLCRVLGYTGKTVASLLTAVKAKKIDMVFAGVGGVGMNTIYWLSELCKLHYKHVLFNSVHMYDRDDIEYANILRFPIPSHKYTESTNADGYYSIIRGGQQKPCNQALVNKTSLAYSYAKKLSPYVHTRYSYLSSTDRQSIRPSGREEPNIVIYGAPEIKDRQFISENIGNLICATHAGNDCSIWLNPTHEDNIQVESYGLIQLNSFFMNQLKLAISLLELLASDQDLSEKNVNVLDHTFAGQSVLSADRQYHWQIYEQQSMLTEAEANTRGVING